MCIYILPVDVGGFWTGEVDRFSGGDFCGPCLACLYLVWSACECMYICIYNFFSTSKKKNSETSPAKTKMILGSPSALDHRSGWYPQVTDAPVGSPGAVISFIDAPVMTPC